jgi:hypothetical protein
VIVDHVLPGTSTHLPLADGRNFNENELQCKTSTSLSLGRCITMAIVHTYGYQEWSMVDKLIDHHRQEEPALDLVLSLILIVVVIRLIAPNRRFGKLHFYTPFMLSIGLLGFIVWSVFITA